MTIRKNNFQIKRLYYETICFDEPIYAIEYVCTSDMATAKIFLDKHLEKHAELNAPDEVNIRIYDIIKDWKRRYKPTPPEMICDGMFWTLEITLSDETTLKYEGYHEIPENFYDLELLFDAAVETKD